MTQWHLLELYTGFSVLRILIRDFLAFSSTRDLTDLCVSLAVFSPLIHAHIEFLALINSSVDLVYKKRSGRFFVSFKYI